MFFFFAAGQRVSRTDVDAAFAESIVQTAVKHRLPPFQLAGEELKHHIRAGSIAQAAVNALFRIKQRQVAFAAGGQVIAYGTAGNRVNAADRRGFPTPAAAFIVKGNLGITVVIEMIGPDFIVAALYAFNGIKPLAFAIAPSMTMFTRDLDCKASARASTQ